jgi:hypothetical protein
VGLPVAQGARKVVCGMSSHKEAAGALVLRCDPDERPLMLAAQPELFYVTPHYEGAEGYVLVRLEAATAEELRERLEDARELATRRRRR